GTFKEFGQYEQYSVQIGEESGNLKTIFHELSLFFSQKNEQRRNLVNALTYPLIILSTAILVVIFMLRMVVPMFGEHFRQDGVELPTVTPWIVAVSKFAGSYGVLALFVLGVLVLLGRPIFDREGFQRQRVYALLRIPYVG